jgi:hypothetical protein
VTQAERELLVARVVAGVVRATVQGVRVEFRRPTRMERLLAEEAYEDAFQEACREGLLSDEELTLYLWEEGLWDDTREKSLREIPKDIEKLKVGLYEHRFNDKECEPIRHLLGKARAKWLELEQERHAHDHHSAAGYARTVRLQYLVGCSVHRAGTRLFPGTSFLDDATDFVGEAATAWCRAQLTESAFRELARTPPWRPLWQCRDGDGLFGVPACDYTDEQQQLVAVSQLYDNVREHPECPPDSVIEDDDMFDGWLILERRKREGDRDRQDIEGSIKDPRIKNSQEVFRVVGSRKEAERVQNLNTPGARAVVAAREKAIREKGTLAEHELPDVKAKLALERNKREFQT